VGNEIEITREELYRLVWSKPGTILAKEFGISDVGLAKICKRLSVTRPQRGYWALLAAGRKMAIPPLPRAKKDTPAKAFISPSLKPEPAIEDNAHTALIESEKLPANHINVAETLHGAHPLIRETRKLLEKGHADDYGRLYASWRDEPKHGWLNLKVTKKSLYRALRIMDALLRAIEARGGKIEVKSRQTLFVMNEVEVRFNLWEKVTRSERDLTKEERAGSYVRDRWIYTPTGEFTFTIEEWNVGKKSWKDKKEKPLEDQLNDIMVGLITASRIVRERGLEREREAIRQLEEERRREEMRRLQQIEDEHREELDTMADLWIKSVNLNQFLLECEKTLSTEAAILPEGIEARWLTWARACADELNPFTSGHLKAVLADHRPQ
jgi:hypothetical protein